MPLSTDDIRRLWIDHYSSKDAVCAVIPSTAYQTIRELATLYPVVINFYCYFYELAVVAYTWDKT